MLNWQLAPGYSALSDAFGSLDRVFALQGEQLTRDEVSDVIRVECGGARYYVKRYRKAGRGMLRNFLGKPRIQGEWENLLWFAKWGLPTAPIAAYGLERRYGRFIRGAMITQEIPNTVDLAHLSKQQDQRLRDADWVDSISRQIAAATRTLHQHGFIHNDLKWRNLLVDDHDRLHLIDCPLGGFWQGMLLDYRIVKDLKCLDHYAKSNLSRTQRLRFYLHYVERTRLLEADKKHVRRILLRRSRRYDKLNKQA